MISDYEEYLRAQVINDFLFRYPASTGYENLVKVVKHG